MNTKIIKFDLNKKLYEKIIAKQGDTKSRFLLFNLLDGAVPFNLTNRSVRAYGLKKDGTEIFNDLIINNAAKGYCTLELTNQMLALPGEVELELMIIEGDKKLTSNIFTLEVRKSINSEKAIVSTNEFTALLNGLASLNEYDNYKNEIKEARGGQTKLKDRLDNFDSYLEQKANEVDLEIERNRINQFTKLAEGSTTGDAELIDARVDFEGVINDNLGETIRNSDKKVKNDLSERNIISLSENLFTTKEETQGYYNSTGEFVNREDIKSCQLIKVYTDDTINLNLETINQYYTLQYFDNSKKWIKSETFYIDDINKLRFDISPQLDGYISLAYLRTITNHKIRRLIIDNIFSEVIKKENIALKGNNISEFNNDLNFISKNNIVKLSDNLFSEDGATTGYYNGTGTFVNSYKSCKNVGCKKGDVIHLKIIKGYHYIQFFNSEGVWLKSIGQDFTNFEKFLKIDAENVSYISISYTSTENEIYVNKVLNDNNYFDYIYSQFIEAKNYYKLVNILTNSTDLSNYVMNFLGDSITYGYIGQGLRMDNPYPKVVGEILKAKTVNNYGLSGCCLSYNNGAGPTKEQSMIKRYLDMDNSADIIGVLGGVNDKSNNVILGDINSTDNTTFYGGLNELAKGLKEKYPQSFIFFMTPLQATSGYLNHNTNGNTLLQFANAVKEVGQKYAIPVLDLYSLGRFCPIIESNKNLYSVDGLHPNQKYILDILAPLIVKFIENNIIN